MDTLTPRERSILALMARGLLDKEIAARLHLAVRTVRCNNTRIYAKLGVRNRVEATLLVLVGQPDIA